MAELEKDWLQFVPLEADRPVRGSGVGVTRLHTRPSARRPPVFACSGGTARAPFLQTLLLMSGAVPSANNPRTVQPQPPEPCGSRTGTETMPDGRWKSAFGIS